MRNSDSDLGSENSGAESGSEYRASPEERYHENFPKFRYAAIVIAEINEEGVIADALRKEFLGQRSILLKTSSLGRRTVFPEGGEPFEVADTSELNHLIPDKPGLCALIFKKIISGGAVLFKYEDGECVIYFSDDGDKTPVQVRRARLEEGGRGTGRRVGSGTGRHEKPDWSSMASIRKQAAKLLKVA